MPSIEHSGKWNEMLTAKAVGIQVAPAGFPFISCLNSRKKGQILHFMLKITRKTERTGPERRHLSTRCLRPFIGLRTQASVREQTDY
jgi:hypothetical protein